MEEDTGYYLSFSSSRSMIPMCRSGVVDICTLGCSYLKNCANSRTFDLKRLV
jgi:hypothetical protein